MNTDQPVESPRPTRRTLVKAAAWSLPAIAVAVAAPSTSASTSWNVSVTAGCVIGIVGVDVLPGFTITASGNAPSSLSFTQTITYTGSFDWNVNILGSKVANQTGAVALGTGAMANYFISTLLEGTSANVEATAYSPNPLQAATYTEGTTTNGAGGARHTTFTLTRTRTVTVTDLGVGGAGITYLFPVGITLPGSAVTNTLTAVSGSGGSSSSDDSATLTNPLLSLTCS